MHAVIRNTPAELIPKELFKEEKIQEYWSVLYSNISQESIGIDDVEECFLLYPKPKDMDTRHEISILYKNIREQFPNEAHAVCLDIFDNNLTLLVLKDMNIVFTGNINFSVNEDIVYHLANISLHFFEDISQITFYYEQLSPKILRFLKKYFEMQQFTTL
jgi:hypothetical protein